ncbi:MAG: Nif3-like dinuclear metal center hexameric protein [Chloroflexota bacterium]
MPPIQAVIDNILTAIPGAPFAETVDVVKTGDPSQGVTGIITTFLASQAVLERAVELGANFIITHEPVFYNHLDETDWLADDPVYLAKRKLIDEHGLVVWRFHDYWHRHKPDGIITGVAQALGWTSYFDPANPYAVTIPMLPLSDLVAYVSDKLACPSPRVIGSPDMPCSVVSLMVGAPGGKWQITALRGVDVLIAGEVNEWDTTEWVRDANRQGLRKALIVVGHALSEEAGMAYLVDWLSPLVPGVAITHVPSGDPFLGG